MPAALLRTAMKSSLKSGWLFRLCCGGDCTVVQDGKSCRRHIFPVYISLMLNCLKFYVLNLIRRDGSA